MSFEKGVSMKAKIILVMVFVFVPFFYVGLTVASNASVAKLGNALHDVAKNVPQKNQTFKKIEPVLITKNMRDLMATWKLKYHDAEYNYLPSDVQKEIIAFLPLDMYAILAEKLEQKLQNSGIIGDELKKIIDQFIIEFITHSFNPKKVAIDPADALLMIAELNVCEAESRKEQYQEIDKRFGLTSKRAQGMNAKGWIECNPGLLQWD